MKKVLVSGVALAASLALGACGLGPATSGGGGGSGAASIVIKVGDNWNQTHPMAAVMDTTFKTQVEEKSGGAIAVETYHSGTLGNEADLWASVRNGTVEMVVIGTVMNQEYPTMLISDWP